MLIWLIGLSGSGKTTIGRSLVQRLKVRHPNVFFLDGDIFRSMFQDDIGYSLDARRKNAARISNFCKELVHQDIHVVCAAMAALPEWRDHNRKEIPGYFEVYLDVPLDVVESRDTKGIYKAARDGIEKNVVGVDIPFPPPERPDLVISEADQRYGIDFCVGKIIDVLPPHFNASNELK